MAPNGLQEEVSRREFDAYTNGRATTGRQIFRPVMEWFQSDSTLSVSYSVSDLLSLCYSGDDEARDVRNLCLEVTCGTMT
eukprot:9531858-Lingulodinium_polyedra.AAC.1